MYEAQNWEAFVGDIDDRYARHGGLEDRCAELDVELERARHGQMRWITAFNTKIIDRLISAVRETEGFEREVFFALAIALWDCVRSNGGQPEMMVGRHHVKRTTPFRTMRGALRWLDEHGSIGLGVGPLSTVVAETADSAHRERVRAAVLGRPRGRAGGFLPMEFMASSPTHVGGSRAKNEDRVLMRNDLKMALAVVPPEDRELLCWVVVGREVRVPKDRMLGDRSRGWKPQWEMEELSMRQAAELAQTLGDTDSVEAIRQRLKRAKAALQDELVRRKLIEPTHGRRRAAREASAYQPVTSSFAGDWS